MLQYVISAILVFFIGAAVTGGKFHGKVAGFAIAIGLALTLLMHLTWAYYLGTIPQILLWSMLALLLGLPAALKAGGMSGKAGGIVPKLSLIPVLTIALTFVSVVLAFVGALALAIFVLAQHRKDLEGSWLVYGKGTGALLCLSLLLGMFLAPALHPSEVRNPLMESLDENETTGPQPRAVTDSEEVRVVSWRLATQYLERAYSNRAAVLDTEPYVLAEDTEPTYVDGKFAWVNAPRYETWKWFGDQDVPFFVYVTNEPSKMKDEDPDIVHRSNQTLNVHHEKIEWKDRIWRELFWRYAGRYEVQQIRIDLDEEFQPHWVIYLSDRSPLYNLPTLRKVVIMSVDDIHELTEYDPQDDSLPPWLEVVYPDTYVYEWVEYWAGSRFGLGYSLVDKKHLYEPDDVSARFIVIDGQTFWQIPLRQKDSNVLGGFVQVDTRTGVATFWDREDLSYASTATAWQQVDAYLRSGEVGFQQLTIDEGHLYPLKLLDGSIREAYIFPLYAGFTVQKYALVDAQDYTAPPVIEDELTEALEVYAQRRGGAQPDNGTGSLRWEPVSLSNAFAQDNEAVLTLSNGTTYVIDPAQLRGGLVDGPADEWRELRLAIADFGAGRNVTLFVAIKEGRIVDVDYPQASLVQREGG